MVRALVSRGEGRWFESGWRRHSHSAVEVGSRPLLEFGKGKTGRRNADHIGLYYTDS